MTLIELEAKLSAATSPSRELDLEIALIVAGTIEKVFNKEREANEYWIAGAVGKAGSYLGFDEDTRDALDFSPEYTSSIDAAIALCEAKLPGTLWNVNLHECEIFIPTSERFRDGEMVRKEFLGRGCSPALALCLAVVRARIEKEKQG